MIQELFSLGKIYPSDFLKPDEQPRCEPVELKLMMDEQGMVFLNETPEANLMWGEKYWYRSSTSQTMREQLKDVVDSIFKVVKVESDSVWVDVAGNDGYLLSQVPSRIVRVNIDPANETYQEEAKQNCDLVIPDYFSAKVYKRYLVETKAKVVTCISMFYDLSEPGEFLDDVNEIMDDDGLFVLQMSYTPLMLQQLEFSNICHEHKFYYSLFNLKALLEKHQFKILDAQLNNTNAGSLRLFIKKMWAREDNFESPTYRDVCKFRINSLLSYEKTLGVDKKETWKMFFDRINMLKKMTIDFVKSQKEQGKVIMGYGASTKGNTALQYFGLTNEYITAIADKSEFKHGLKTIGTNIPIISEESMREQQPDILIVLPFHFLGEFVKRENDYLQKGGTMVSLMPHLTIIDKNSL